MFISVIFYAGMYPLKILHGLYYFMRLEFCMKNTFGKIIGKIENVSANSIQKLLQTVTFAR
jgi:hypothetical protein